MCSNVSKTPKYIEFIIMYDIKKKQNILSFKKLEPESVWHLKQLAISSFDICINRCFSSTNKFKN